MLLGVGGLAGTSASASTPPTPVGHVYINDNTAGSNTIAAFNRYADGSLVPEKGAPFPAGGAGSGVGTGSQGSLQETPDGRYLLAVDAGSNQISVMQIEPNGGLRAIAGSPVSSDGIDPVSIAIDPNTAGSGSGDPVYVANAGTGGSNYTGFTISNAGRLRPLTGSTVPLPDGSQPGDVLFNGTGSHLVGTRVGTSLVDSFDVAADGRLTTAVGSPFPAQGPGPIGAEFRPTNSSQLFVTNAHGGTGNGTVSGFTVAADAALTSIGAGPFPDSQTAPCWIEISADGRYLFAVNTATPSISRYAVGNNGSLRLLGSTPLNPTTESKPVDARLSPDGRTLFVNDSGSDAISAFTVNGGNLTEIATSPTALPAGVVSPAGVVVN